MSDFYDERPALVGQAPSENGDPGRPMTGRSGFRLAEMAGIDKRELKLRFLARFEKRNVLNYYPGSNGEGDVFPMEEARQRGKYLAVELSPRTILACGKKTTEALTGAPAEAVHYFQLLMGDESSSSFVIPIPHPSGVNRWWNSEDNRGVYRSFMRQFIRMRGWSVLSEAVSVERKDEEVSDWKEPRTSN